MEKQNSSGGLLERFSDLCTEMNAHCVLIMEAPKGTTALRLTDTRLCRGVITLPLPDHGAVGCRTDDELLASARIALTNARDALASQPEKRHA